EADERGEEGASELFRFDEPKRFTAGLDTSPDSQETRLVNLWSAKRSFQLISAVVLLTLAFYIFVGVTGGITDAAMRAEMNQSRENRDTMTCRAHGLSCRQKGAAAVY
ncbi:MAG: hypothetical protein SGPRY_006290, partial [Prymnesium sp.]